MAVQTPSAEFLLLADFGNMLDKFWIEEIARPFEEDTTFDVAGGVFLPVIRSDFELCVAAIRYPLSCRLAKMPPKQRQAVVPNKPDPGGLSIGITRDLWQRKGGMPDWLRAAADKMFGRKFMAGAAKICNHASVAAGRRPDQRGPDRLCLAQGRSQDRPGR